MHQYLLNLDTIHALNACNKKSTTGVGCGRRVIGRGELGSLAELLLAHDHHFGEARHLVLSFALMDGTAGVRVDVLATARFDGFLGQMAGDVPQGDMALSELDALELNSEAVEQRLGQVSDGLAEETLDLRPLVEIRIECLTPDVENILPRRLHQHEAGTTVVRGERHRVLNHESWRSAVSSKSIGMLMEHSHQRPFRWRVPPYFPRRVRAEILIRGSIP